MDEPEHALADELHRAVERDQERRRRRAGLAAPSATGRGFRRQASPRTPRPANAKKRTSDASPTWPADGHAPQRRLRHADGQRRPPRG
ncbi:MAG: hypothetical protein MZV63_18020 [Marinilabiliales bacterium]|nr:hypothetical protein [Marinilabiliales bacterium]